ncbi:MAG TPA: hypothetical protein VMU59_06995 [Caulobacteraceae bacterium]|nr:hypothetical protein [Caulobacteraceae bacterium]
MSKFVSKARAAAVSPAQLADRVGVAGLLGLGLAVAAALVQVPV